MMQHTVAAECFPNSHTERRPSFGYERRIAVPSLIAIAGLLTKPRNATARNRTAHPQINAPAPSASHSDEIALIQSP